MDVGLVYPKLEDDPWMLDQCILTQHQWMLGYPYPASMDARLVHPSASMDAGLVYPYQSVYMA
jgi:hypothetical protein